MHSQEATAEGEGDDSQRNGEGRVGSGGSDSISKLGTQLQNGPGEEEHRRRRQVQDGETAQERAGRRGICGLIAKGFHLSL